MIESIQSTGSEKAVWQYSVELVMIPFELHNVLYDDINCDGFDTEQRTQRLKEVMI